MIDERCIGQWLDKVNSIAKTAGYSTEKKCSGFYNLRNVSKLLSILDQALPRLNHQASQSPVAPKDTTTSIK